MVDYTGSEKFKLGGLGNGIRSLLGNCINFTFCCTGQKTVEQGEIGIWLRNGEYYKKVGPGLYLTNPFIDEFNTINTKIKVKIY